MDGIDSDTVAVQAVDLQPGDLVTIRSLVDERFPTHPYMFGVSVAWLAVSRSHVYVHDHMGGTWLLHPSAYVLRLS